MPDMVIGSENYVISNRGILKISEISQNDKVLGLQRGKLEWGFLTIDKPEAAADLVKIISKKNEISLGSSTRISLLGKRKRADMLAGQEQVELIGSRALKDYLQQIKWSKTPLNFKGEKIEFSPWLAYFCGFLHRRIYPNERSIIIKISGEYEEIKKLGKKIEQKLNKETDIHGGYFQIKSEEGPYLFHWLILRKNDFLNFLIKNVENGNIPNILRTYSYDIFRCYLVGIIDAFGTGDEKGVSQLLTFNKESEIRRLIYNASLFIDGFAISNTVPKPTHLPHYFCSDLIIPSSLGGLRRYESTPPRTDRKNYSKILFVYETQAPAYKITLPTEGWAPVVELAYLYSP